MTRMNRLLIIGLICITHFTNLFSQEVKINKKNFDSVNKLLTSKDKISELNVKTEELIYLIKIWVFVDKKPDTMDKLRLKNLIDTEIPLLLSELTHLSTDWSSTNKMLLESISNEINNFNKKIKYIMELLGDMSNYDDPLTIFEVVPMVEYGGEVIEEHKLITIKIRALEEEFIADTEQYFPKLDIFSKPSEDDPKNQEIEEYYVQAGIDDKVNHLYSDIKSELNNRKSDLGTEIYNSKLQIFEEKYDEDTVKSNIFMIIDNSLDINDLEKINKIYRNPDLSEAIEINELIKKKIELYIIEYINSLFNE